METSNKNSCLPLDLGGVTRLANQEGFPSSKRSERAGVGVRRKARFGNEEERALVVAPFPTRICGLQPQIFGRQ